MELEHWSHLRSWSAPARLPPKKKHEGVFFQFSWWFLFYTPGLNFRNMETWNRVSLQVSICEPVISGNMTDVPHEISWNCLRFRASKKALNEIAWQLSMQTKHSWQQLDSLETLPKKPQEARVAVLCIVQLLSKLRKNCLKDKAIKFARGWFIYSPMYVYLHIT